MSIQLIGDWPNTSISDADYIVGEVYRSFQLLIGPVLDEKALPLIVQNDPEASCPRALYAKVGVRNHILLNVGSGSRWSQIAFQLSHELTHLLSNHREVQTHKYKWFEESLCELGSRANLKHMARLWETHGLPDLSSYSHHLDDYVQERERNTEQVNKFDDWLGRHLPEMQQNSVLRERNDVIAARLLPVFEQSPELWVAVSFLNTWTPNPADSLEDYLSDWQHQCPPELQQPLSRVAERMGTLTEIA
ncbi:MAG: hypothetical protein AAF515_05010 [Pseudomonadota bacterium]